MRRILFALFAGCLCASGEVTYQLTDGASACAEVRIPKWTSPPRGDAPFSVSSYSCGYDLRKRGSTLLVGLSCGYATQWRMTEKYAIDMVHPEAVSLADESAWETATILDRGMYGEWNAYLKEPASPIRLPKSGPKWGGGVASQGGSREAVYSWSGTVRDPVGPLPYEGSVVDWLAGLVSPWAQARYEGHFWTDIYDVGSARRLVQIRGDFHRESPYYFQGRARWFDGRFYLLPLETNAPFRLPEKRDGMRRLLVCDIDAAAKAKGVAESDAPVPPDRAKPFFQHSRSDYQMRFLVPVTAQAHITGFDDEPVLYPGTNDIEKVNITALLDVLVPGQYTLLLDVGGIEQRAQAELSVGSARLTVPVPAASLRELGLGGPFRIYHARLTRQAGDGEIVAENRFARQLAAALQLRPVDLVDAITQPYSLSALGSTLHFTGENSAKLIRGIGSVPHRLEVRIGIYSQDADCRGSGLLVNAPLPYDSAVVDSPGGKALVLKFAGKGISPEGPYRIEQVGVKCGRSFIRSGRIDIPAN